MHIQSCISEYQITGTLYGTSVTNTETTNAVTLQKTHLQMQATSAGLSIWAFLNVSYTFL